MSKMDITGMDRALARVCETCPVCRTARNNQRGIAWHFVKGVEAGVCPVCRTARNNQRGIAWHFVKGVEAGVCPFCRAYERVHGRKAHEPGRDEK